MSGGGNFGASAGNSRGSEHAHGLLARLERVTGHLEGGLAGLHPA